MPCRGRIQNNTHYKVSESERSAARGPRWEKPQWQVYLLTHSEKLRGRELKSCFYQLKLSLIFRICINLWSFHRALIDVWLRSYCVFSGNKHDGALVVRWFEMRVRDGRRAGRRMSRPHQSCRPPLPFHPDNAPQSKVKTSPLTIRSLAARLISADHPCKCHYPPTLIPPKIKPKLTTTNTAISKNRGRLRPGVRSGEDRLSLSNTLIHRVLQGDPRRRRLVKGSEWHFTRMLKVVVCTLWRLLGGMRVLNANRKTCFQLHPAAGGRRGRCRRWMKDGAL